MISVLLYIFTSTVLISSFIIFVQYTKNNFSKELKEKLISVLLFLLAFRFFALFVSINGLINEFPHFLLLDVFTFRLILPIFFISVYLEFYPRRIHWKDSLHLIPFFVFLINFFPILTASSETKKSIISKMGALGPSYLADQGYLLSGQSVLMLRFTLLLAYLLGIGFILHYGGHFTKLTKKVKWFYFALYGYFGLNLLFGLILDSQFLKGLNFFFWVDLFSFGTALPLLIFAFFIPEFLFGSDLDSSNNRGINKNPSIYLKNTPPISIPELEDEIHLIEKIDLLFDDKRVFLNSDLTLSDLEKELGISGRYISEAIKEKYNASFNNYLNFKRIEYFRWYVSNRTRANKKIYIISSDVGFKSVTSFYSYSKKILGQTPAEYIQKQLEVLGNSKDGK